MRLFRKAIINPVIKLTFDSCIESKKKAKKKKKSLKKASNLPTNYSVYFS